MMSYIALLTGVPWDNSYAHTRLFTDANSQLSYFQGFTPIWESYNFNFIKAQGRDFVDIPMHIDEVKNANYLYFINTQTDSKYYYCFVLDVVMLTRASTRVFFSRDIMQTWMFDYKLNQCIIEREHVASSTVKNIVPEDVMTGNEYETVGRIKLNPVTTSAGTPIKFLVMAMKRPIDDTYTASPRVSNWMGRAPEQLIYYYFPFATDLSAISMSLGGATVTYTVDQISALLWGFSQPTTDVATKAANNIVNMYVADMLPYDLSSGNYSNVEINITGAPNSTLTCNLLIISQNVTSPNDSVNVNVTLYNDNKIPGVDAEKLNYYPFTKIEIYDSRGNSVTYKPEGLPSDTFDVTFFPSVGANQALFAGISGYNGDDIPALVKTRSLINQSPQDVPIITDYLAAFLQGNKNSLENQRNILDENLAFNQSQQRMRFASASIGRAMSTVGTVAGIALAPVTAGASLGLTAASLGANAIRSGIDTAAQLNSMQHLTTVYEQNLNSIMARQEDLEEKPPAVSAASANLNMLLGHDLMNYTVAIKRVRPQYIQMASDYFKLFGFRTNRLGIPNLNTRTSWNFIKLGMANLTSGVYNDDFTLIKDIYQNGITLWHNNNVMDYTQSNNEVT